MAITWGIFPRYALALNKARIISDEILPSTSRRRQVRHSPKEDVGFVCSEHLTTSGKGYHELHRSVTKRTEALNPPTASLRKRKFTISALTAAIHEKDTVTKVEHSRITHQRIPHTRIPFQRHNPLIETLAILPTSIQPAVYQELPPSDSSFSKSILTNPSSNPQSYAALLCNELHQVRVNIGKNVIPTRYDVLRNFRFGKLDLAHSFTSEAYFEHILLHLLKSNVLSQSETTSLLSCYLLSLHLHKMMQWTKRIDFSLLGHTIVNYITQQQISTTRVQ